MRIAVIGGGAAGFFAAIAVKENYPKANVVLYEKSQKILSKVKISGGGRCNVTNGCTSIGQLAEGYPRGGKKLKNLFKEFDNQHTQKWFTTKGVPLKTEADNRVFPVSDKSQSIIDCLLKQVDRLGIVVEMGKGIKRIHKLEGGQLDLEFNDTSLKSRTFHKVIVAAGGFPMKKGFDWLEKIGHKIEPPVPSLFTFNMPSEKITKLMGVVAENALLSIQSTKLKSTGPLLITHWGMSGPAILKLSAFGARVLNDLAYQFKVQVNWVNVVKHEEVYAELHLLSESNAKKNLANIKPYKLPERLWLFLLQKADLSEQKKWGEIGKKGINKLVTLLTNDVYNVSGKTTFKEEFVTCGGVSLGDINFKTMESKVCKNLYFAGEVLDIDGITGGYNFQAAWTTAFIAGRLA